MKPNSLYKNASIYYSDNYFGLVLVDNVLICTINLLSLPKIGPNLLIALEKPILPDTTP